MRVKCQWPSKTEPSKECILHRDKRPHGGINGLMLLDGSTAVEKLNSTDHIIRYGVTSRSVQYPQPAGVSSTDPGPLQSHAVS